MGSQLILLIHDIQDIAHKKIAKTVRGEKKDTVGFITAVNEGGSVDFYPCTIPKMISIKTGKLPETEAPTHSADPFPKSVYQIQDCTYLAEQYSYCVPTVHLKFAPIDGKAHGYRVEQESAVLGQPSGYSKTAFKAVEDAHSFDERRRGWVRDIMSTGRGYVGCEVRVVGKQGGGIGGGQKGLYGVVKGYSFRPELTNEQKKAQEEDMRRRREAEEMGRTVKGCVEPSLAGWDGLKDAVLQIQYENTLQQENVWLGRLQERYSGLPLAYAMYFKTVGPKYTKIAPAKIAPEIDVGPLVSAAEAWPETCSVPEAPAHPFGPAPEFGELLGHWFAGPKFVNKQLDVKVERVGACIVKYGSKINPRMLGHEGSHGFITPFSSAFSDSHLDKKFVEIRKLPLHHTALVPPPAIKPYRRTEPDASGIDGCISAAVGHVVVIGPDVTGADDRRGHYAETVPASLQYGTPIVEVRFPMESGGRPPNRCYHLECLCRALNQELAHWKIPATDFDALPTSK
ncbi:hypothetical protein B0H19DRAFT_1277249 [Mycena capillaripes]|nr:hypothetical protein B0H19DRAFT_1277249 [Mycena capillaripes]